MRRRSHLIRRSLNRGINPLNPLAGSPAVRDNRLPCSVCCMRENIVRKGLNRSKSWINLEKRILNCFSVEFLCRTWGSMTYRYIAEIRDGERRMMRIIPGIAMQKADFRRNALIPTDTGAALWRFPMVWLTDRADGYWESLVMPKPEDRVFRSTWATILFSKGGDRSRAAVEEGSALSTKRSGEAYPAGMPLRQGEIKASRNFRPQ